MTLRKAENPMPGELSLEQLFKLRSIQQQAASLSLKEAQEFVVELFRQQMIKDNLMRELMREKL